jgi:tetratricopeptide (TPR) repeat protein
VIHRDLKPQNVMLGPFGETLVVDWGLAKAGLDPAGRDPATDPTTDPAVRPASGSGPAPTQAGSALGTPGYMSPEQAAGRHDQVGPASDVFSLGATLYCLLTGRKPFEGTTVADEVARTRKGEFPPAREVNPDAPAALDAVCRRAMAFAPADRYPSALDLAADVERWLADEPVAVYRDPWPVRAGRWARRHRTSVAAGLVLLVTTAVASGVGTGLVWREQRKTAERKREAEENYHLARDLSGSGIELIAANEAQYAADPVKHKARKELLVAAAKAYHKHLEHQPDDPEVRRQAARVFRYAANVHRLEREHAPAEALYADAVGLLEGLTNSAPEDPKLRLQLCETLRDQAKLPSTLGRLDESVKALDRVVEMARAALATTPSDAGWQWALAVGLLNRSSVQYVRGKLKEAAADAADADTGFEALKRIPARAHPYDPILQGSARNLRAVIERDSGRLREAYFLHQQAIDLVRPIVKAPVPGVNPADATHVEACFRLEQARTFALTGQKESRAAADDNLGKTAEKWEALAAAHPEVRDYPEMAGIAYYERGRLRAEFGPRPDAFADLQKSQAILGAEVRGCPDVPSLSGDLGRTYAALARLARVEGDATATQLYRSAIDLLRSAVERAPERVKDRTDLRAVQAEGSR